MNIIILKPKLRLKSNKIKLETKIKKTETKMILIITLN